MPFLVQIYQQKRGLIRAFIIRGSIDRPFAQRAARIAQTISQQLITLLEARRDEIRHPDPVLAIDFALRMAFDMLDQATLYSGIERTTVPLANEQLAEELVRAFLSYLGVDAALDWERPAQRREPRSKHRELNRSCPCRKQHIVHTLSHERIGETEMNKPMLSLIAIAALTAALPAMAADEASPVGKKVENFTGRDFRGKETSLADLAGSKAVVVAFIGTECPQAKQYGLPLAKMAAEYKDRGVAFIAVDSNQQDSVTDLAHYASEHKIEFPVLKDAGNVIADQLGAVRTPEVFLLDGQRVVRYWGRIDDQFGFQGKGVAYQRTSRRAATWRWPSTKCLRARTSRSRRSPAKVAASAAFASRTRTAT